ncbi:selenocysteine-specific translation elongation factor [Mogibacterium neglectum]|uniref:selenocysteine-specific translation elongation factor n=1 Tax=Mogibacterium neglectum TaxID=114528 RepID=UPI00272C9BA9|nr:selenocysteine-specific translation elongation factor [Mogibacterium neglectum]WLD76625.1 selenocysteine-specific translation elongation factor [Mogibacterium neglectum]
MKNVIIGTAGHVDHGKTQLIKALSGIDTDRLSEEKKRGITIELGFAHIDNDAGYNIGVIDVPGHEKFIKNMLAGIGGIDFVLFVVAADEGIMPQTKEHFEILQALGINDGIITITKKDMVDEEWLGMLVEDVKEYFKGSFLEGKPLIAVSSKTGENIGVLKEEIIKKCDRESKRHEEPELFRLPIDRVFSMQGFGTVVTGTLVDGVLKLNDEMNIYPDDIPVKVRGIQTYGNDTDEAFAGQRTAVNLSGIKKENVTRGSVLAASGAVTVTNMLDVEMSVFKSSDRQILNNSRVHFYTGSTEVIAKVIIMDRDVMMSGDKASVQLRLEEPVAVRRGDKFIIRFYSPVITVGGGRVLDANPEKHKRNRDDVLADFRVLAAGDIEDIIHLKAGKWKYYKEHELGHELGLTAAEIKQAVQSLDDKGKVIILADGSIVSEEKLKILEDTVSKIIEEYHSQNPMVDGIPKRELLSRIKEYHHIEDDKLGQAIISKFLDSGMLEDKEKTISLAGFKVEFSNEQLALMDEIKKMYDKAGVETIKNEYIYEFVGDKNIASAIQTELASQGEIFKLDASYYIDTNAWDVAVAAGRELGTEKPEGFTLAEYRDKLEISRKFASVLLSALDKYGITVFNGECRKAIK